MKRPQVFNENLSEYTIEQATQMLAASDYNLDQALQLFCNDEYDEPMISQPELEEEEEVRPAFNIRETRILVEEEDSSKIRNLQNVKRRVADNFRDFRTEIGECSGTNFRFPHLRY